METILTTGSLLFRLYKSEIEESQQHAILCLVCTICAIITFLQLRPPLKLQRFSRPDAAPALFYGCVLFPAILSVNITDTNALNAVSSLVLSLATLIIYVIICDINNSIKYATALLISCLCLYYVQTCKQVDYFSMLFKFCAYLFTFVSCYIGCLQSFSIGEAVLVSQMTASFYHISNFNDFSDNPFNLMEVAISFGCVTALFVMVSILCFIFVKTRTTKTACFYTTALVIGLSYSAVNKRWLSVNFKAILLFLVASPQRIFMLFLWLCLICMCSVYISFRSSKLNASTSERKVFHVFILLVYIPGLIFDIPLLFLSSVCVCCLFAVMGVMHAFSIEPFGNVLQNTLIVFTGKQDTGTFILTPVYLLLGLSFPVWMSCVRNLHLLEEVGLKAPIESYSGVISVGIGDAVASVIGSKYGSYQFQGKSKTLEGTIASIISQLVTIYLLHSFNCVNVTSGDLLMSTSIVAFTEAYTDQIDNLVLPLLMYWLLL